MLLFIFSPTLARNCRTFGCFGVVIVQFCGNYDEKSVNRRRGNGCVVNGQSTICHLFNSEFFVDTENVRVDFAYYFSPT